MTRAQTAPAAVSWLRHLLSILLLPTVVTVVVPRWLVRSWAAVDSRWPAGVMAWAPRTSGIVLILAGIGLAGWCILLFARVGRGTLAPWDPTSRLVAVGPYRYTRNPMITGVATILAGEAALAGSWVLGLWMLLFVTINHVYFLRSEEPGMERRFGAAYLDYKRTVPRWIPRRPRRQGPGCGGESNHSSPA